MTLAVICFASPSVASAATYHLAASGSDAAPGTEDQPWRTVQKAIDTLRPGDTVYVHPGTYGARGTITTADLSGTASARIAFRAVPGAAKPQILGHFKITGSNLKFARLIFDGPTGRVKPVVEDNPRGEQVQVAVEGDNVVIARSIVRDSDWHAGIYLSGAEDARIYANCVTGNGDEQLRQYQWNTSHGIYWSSGSGILANNLIANNLARGVQLYGDPHDVMVAQNTVVRNGRAGIQFASQTEDSTAVNNVVAFNGDVGIRGHDLTGRGNVAVDNLGYRNDNGNFGIGVGEEGLDFVGNSVGDPAFVAPGSGDYRLRTRSDAIDEARAKYSREADQEGVKRPQGGAPDHGAYERPTKGAGGADPVCR